MTPPNEPSRSGAPSVAELAAKPLPIHRRLAARLRERPGLRLAVIALAVVALALGVYLWRHSAVRESTDDAFVEAHVVAVAAKVPGTVEKVNVDVNQRVAAGTVLLELDRHDYELAVARAEADLAAAQAAAAAAAAKVPIASTTSSSGTSVASARLGQAQSGVAAANAAIAAAQARVDAARANADRADQDVARLAALVAKDEVSREEYEHAQATARAARAAVGEAEQGVAAARSRAAQATADVASAQAGVAQAGSGPQQVEAARAEADVAAAKARQAQVALDLARSQLDDTVVKAPVAGLVGRRNAEPGQTVAGGQPLLAIVPEQGVWITANFKETQLAHMRPGQKATVHVDAFDHELAGHVESIGAATGGTFSLLPAQNSSGNFVKVVQRVPVKIVLDEQPDAAHPLRPGMSVVPTVITE